MKNLFTVFVVMTLSIISANSHSGDSIFVKRGSTPIIDGIISDGEWIDASFVEIAQIGGKVYFKYDTADLYVAFTDGMNYSISTGIYFDKLHIGGSNLQSEHLRLHGSASQWEWIGLDTLWQKEVPSGWIYVFNKANEYKISLSKLGITETSEKIIGVLFSFLDWSSGYEITWPNGGFKNCSNPNTWANMIISPSTDIIEQIKTDDFIPNLYYTNDIIFLKLPDNSNTKVEILNIFGQIEFSTEFHNANAEIDFRNFACGAYFVKITKNNRSILKSFIKM